MNQTKIFTYNLTNQMRDFTLVGAHKPNKFCIDNLTNQMRVFISGEAHEPNIDFHEKSHKPNKSFWLSLQTKQQLLNKYIAHEISFSCANYNNTLAPKYTRKPSLVFFTLKG